MQTGGKTVAKADRYCCRFANGSRVILQKDFQFLRNGQAGIVVSTELIRGQWHVKLNFAPIMPIPEELFGE